MDCARIRRDELIESYLGHQLDESASDELETHMLGCPDCSQLLENLLSLRSELEKRATIIRAATTKEKSFLFWLPTAATAAVVLAAGLGLLHLWKAKRERLTVAALPHPRPEATLPEAQAKADFDPSHTTLSARTPSTHNTPGKEDRTAGLPSGASASSASQTPTEVQGEVAASLEQRSGESEPKPDDIKPKESATAAPRLPAAQVDPKAAANTPDASADANQIKLTSAQGAELLRIGAVEPPPFGFAGFGKRAKDPRGRTGNAFGKRKGTSDTGRVLFQSGMDAYAEGRYRDALDFLVSAARQDEKTDDVNFYLGICQIFTGHLQDAEGSFQRIIASGNSVYLQPAHYYLGKTYVQLMKLDKAGAEFRAAASLPGQLTADAKALDVRVSALRAELQSK